MNEASQPTIQLRAQRFPLHLPIQYRAKGSSQWYSGQTENISCSGVLFRCKYGLQQDAPIELVLPLPWLASQETRVKVVCNGRIARLRSLALQGERMEMAASFTRFRFVRGSESLDEGHERLQRP
jgi:hypothetical protein